MYQAQGTNQFLNALNEKPNCQNAINSKEVGEEENLHTSAVGYQLMTFETPAAMLGHLHQRFKAQKLCLISLNLSTTN